MAIHPGFPDLSNARRGALLRLIDRLAIRSELSKRLLAAAVENEVGREFIAIATDRRTAYDRLMDWSNMQFPEIRADLPPGSIKPSHARTNSEILQAMRWVDADIADALGVSRPDLRKWFDGDAAVMPPPLPLMARIPADREEAIVA